MMRLAELLKNHYPLPNHADRDIGKLVLDSRAVQHNDVFIAIKGTEKDGRTYIADAIDRGACAVLYEPDDDSFSFSENQQAILIPIAELKTALGEMAATFYQHPAKQLRMVGVTGTNGKTSCTHFIAEILQRCQNTCGIIGTLGAGLYGALSESGMTTPDAITLQSLLRHLHTAGAKAVAMEVSSHSIQQNRISGLDFEIGIFTNLTQDHLDYHGDMATYAAVKHRFLDDPCVKQVIVNAEDDYGSAWLPLLANKKSTFAYSTTPLSLPIDIPFIYADNVQLSLQGITAQVHTPWGNDELHLPLIGRFNLSNALAALATLCLYGLPFPMVLQQLSMLHSVPGRMQSLGGKDQPLIVVDYAHTPDALEKALQALRLHTNHQLLCVFGCGGDRDASKRPLMAAVTERYADKVIVTNDNPRYEQPEAIIADIMKGFQHPERIVIELDRSKAIKNSIQWATQQDCVLIAGKGAEHYQQINGRKIPFNDVEEVKRAILNK